VWKTQLLNFETVLAVENVHWPKVDSIAMFLSHHHISSNKIQNICQILKSYALKLKTTVKPLTA